MQPVRKAVIPAAGLGTRFLPATKSIPKEMLPVVDRPAIQYVVEEAVQAGLTDILIITGRNKRAVEDHFDRNFELEHYLEATGKHDDARRKCSSPPTSPTSTTCASAIRSVSGTRCRSRVITSATSRSRCCSPTTSWSTTRRCSARCSAPTTASGRSVVAVQEVSPEEISSYGCVEPDGVGRRRRRRRSAASSRSRAREVAPSNLAVIGRYVFTPGDLRRARSHRARRGRRAPAHRRDRAAARRAERARVALRRRPLRRRAEARLPARQHRARARPRRSRPAARRMDRASSCSGGASRSRRDRVIPLAEAQQRILDAVAPLTPRPVALARGARARARARRDRVGDGAAVREHRDGRLRGARVRHGRRVRARRRRRCAWSASSRRAPRPPSRSGRRGDPDHDRRADAGRRRRGRDGGAHACGRRRPSTIFEAADARRSRAARGRRSRGRPAGVRGRNAAHARASRCARQPRRRRGPVSPAAAGRCVLDRRRARRERARSRPG